MKTYNCIFTGGSVRGLCYVGALKAFEENNINEKSKTLIKIKMRDCLL